LKPGPHLEPILCAPLIRKVDNHLIELLGELSADEWDLQTVAPAWKVRDVAAHLLDTALRKLSLVRDSCYVEAVEIRSPQDLATFVNRLNREGVAVYRRLSSTVLVELLKIACEQSAGFHESLDPFAPAVFAVSWAGEETSLNWFDTARELTERWHHQQQIRFATDRTGIMTPELYHPVLDCFLRGLPHVFKGVDAPVGSNVLVEISGRCGGIWTLSKERDSWNLVREPDGEITSRVIIPEALAWRLFTRGVDRIAAQTEIDVIGDGKLAERALSLTAIVA
jgi:uncharacterized protein (TIGR03083 family)